MDIRNHNVQNEKTEYGTNRILSQEDLYNILPFGKTKVSQLIRSGELPLVKIGKDYITTYNILEDWVRTHVGEEIYY